MTHPTASRMAWLLCLPLALVMLSPFLAREAGAHPLGNFTVNHYSRVEFADETARVTYVLDLAEIPTLQQKESLDTDGDGKLSGAESGAYLDAALPSLVKNLRLEVGGEALILRVLDRSATFVPGQGGLPTLRIETRLRAELPENWEEEGAGRYADLNHENRQGWREIVVLGGRGVAVERSTVPSVDATNELRSYPQDSLSSPPDDREARFVLGPGDGTTADGAAGRGGVDDGGVTGRIAGLVSTDRPSASVAALSVLAAFLWGAAHALTPGHGKTVVAAYLVGARGTIRHAGILGLTVTLTHTAGVFALGAVALYLSRYVVPEDLYPWLTVSSGLLVVTIGLSLLYNRSRKLLAPRTNHGHPHEHSHGRPGAGWRGLVALGISGGLVPCPAALVLLLGAVSLGRTGFGVALVVAFSTGLAAVLTGIGVLMIHARRVFDRYSFEARAPRLLPVASALVISLVGLIIVAGSLNGAGLV